MKKLIIIAIVIVFGVVATLSMKAKRIDNPLPANVTADKVLIEKSKRRLTLLNKNTPLKAYEISLGKEPIGKKQKKEMDELQKEFIRLTDENSKAVITEHCMFPIQTKRTQPKQKQEAYLLAVTSWFTDYRMALDLSENFIQNEIGPSAALL